jgi:type I restriction enzyme, S subunit
MSVEFKYVPLTFISTREAIESQLRNTIIFKKIIARYNNCIPLGELIHSTQYGYTASAKEAGSHKLLRITDINNGLVNWSSVPLCNCDREKTYLLSKGDVLIARTGNNISYIVEENTPNNVVFASYLIRIVCDRSKLLPEYLFLFLNSYAFWPQILLKQRGALLQNVNANLMRQLLIPICSVEEQMDIVAKANTELVKSIEIDTKKILALYNAKCNISTELNYQLSLVKKLRQQLLQDAMQGKLVKQSPNDEPANKLLKRIKAEKNKQIAEKKLKREKELPAIKPEEIPFEIPRNWVWCRLGETGILKRGKSKHRPRNDVSLFENGIYPFIQTGDVARSKAAGYIIQTINGYYNDFGLSQSVMQKKGTLCITIAANIAECGFLGFDACAPDSIVCYTSIQQIIEKYCFYYIIQAREAIERYAPATAQKNINLEILNLLLIPFPPLEEQNLIVQKIDELMQYCNDLEASIKFTQDQNEKLLQQVLKEALRAN